MANTDRGQSQKSFLGELSDRLYRALGLDGPVSADVSYTVLPTIQVADGTLPGMGSQRLRRFAFGGQTNYFTQIHHFKALQDLIILRMDFDYDTFAAFGKFILSYKGPDDAIGAEVPGGIDTGCFIDRAKTMNEIAPIQQLVGGAIGTKFFAGALQSGFSRVVFETPFFLQSGARIIVSGSAGVGSSPNFNLIGMTF